MNTGIIILAAGNSSRLGKPKQLLTFRGTTLLEIVTRAAIESGCKPLVVVLGAYSSEISKQQQDPNINYIINDSWQEGISSSIAAGLTDIMNLDQEVEQVIIAVSDQPFINSTVFLDLIKKQEETGKNMVTSSYAQTIGTPALFNKKYFDQLLSLTGNHGAKHILEQHPEDIASILFEAGKIDIDTETDYDNLIHQQ